MEYPNINAPHAAMPAQTMPNVNAPHSVMPAYMPNVAPHATMPTHYAPHAAAKVKGGTPAYTAPVSTLGYGPMTPASMILVLFILLVIISRRHLIKC